MRASSIFTVAAIAGCATLAVVALTGPSATQDRRPLVGVVSQLSLEQLMINLEPFRQRLTELGYVEGQNIFIEYRVADNDLSRLPAMAAELVQLQPDVIYSVSTAATRAVTAATTTIPIVASGAGDLVAAGWAISVERPGGNVTGLQEPSPVPGQFALALELVPGATRIGALLDATFAGVAVDREAFTAAAGTLGVQLVMVEYNPADGPDAAFARFQEEQVDAVINRVTAAQTVVRARLVELAALARLPTVGAAAFVTAGGLASYGSLTSQRPTLAANVVDQILKGASPAELALLPDPPSITINLLTAQALGLVVTPELRARATQLIQ